MNLRLILVFALLCPFASPALTLAASKQPSTYRIPLPPKPDFSQLKWMVGDWTGWTVKKSAPADIHLSISFDLDRRIMFFRQDISFAETKNAPGESETWLGILTGTSAADPYVLEIYSSTGFITRYHVTLTATGVRFDPDGGTQPPPGWLSRIVIDRAEDEGFTETVQLAPPQGSFFDYYRAKFTRNSDKESGVSGQKSEAKRQKPE